VRYLLVWTCRIFDGWPENKTYEGDHMLCGRTTYGECEKCQDELSCECIPRANFLMGISMDFLQ
jgi:hypothetical protein